MKYTNGIVLELEEDKYTMLFLEGAPRSWRKCMCRLWMLMILYDVSLIDEHVLGLNFYIWWWLHMILCYMKKSITYNDISCLFDCVQLWGFKWASHWYAWDEIVGKIIVCYDVINSIRCIVVMTLCWIYSCWCLTLCLWYPCWLNFIMMLVLCWMDMS